jgi:integrase
MAAMRKRRTRGCGSLFQVGRIWYIQYYDHGRKISESSRYEDREQAENLLKDRMAGIASGREVTPSKATVADLCGLVLADYRLRKRRDTQHVEWRFKAHIEEALGSIRASRLTAAQIRGYVEDRRKADASDATINRELAILRRAFTLAMREDPPLVRRGPYVPKLEEDNARQGFLEPEQYERLLEELPVRLKALFVCGYHTGARKGELRKVRWEQVDFDAALLRLSAGQTKGKKARTLPIYGDMERWLRFQQNDCPNGCPWVFFGAHKQAVSLHLPGWKKACERAGLPGLLFHDLRRSAVRNMKRAGVQDKVAMEISGHKTRAIFDRYNITDEGDIGNAADKLEDYFRRRKQERAAKLRRVK